MQDYDFNNSMYVVKRDVTTDECHWLNETIKEGSVVYKFYGATYGCIDSGVAVTLSKEGKNPFFEMPYDSLNKLPLR
jgi:hypothetical protein